MSPDADRVAALLREVAESEILPRFRHLAAADVFEKTGPRDLVTAADLAAEARLARGLRDLLPGSVVVGEEGAARDPGVLARLSEDAPVWLVDPLDGTLNFTQGKAPFTVIVALVRAGETVGGWIHEPLAGVTACAAKGEGARADGAPLAVAAPAPLAEMTAALYVGPGRAPALYGRLQALRPRLGPRHFTRCAGAEYLALVRATVHYAVFTRLLPWDHAAGCLIHAEAGGTGACLDGRPYRPRPMDGPLLLAPDAPTWRRLAALFGGAEGQGDAEVNPCG